MCYPICEHWGIAQDINVKSMRQILEAMVACRAAGGSFAWDFYKVRRKPASATPRLPWGVRTMGSKHEIPFFQGVPCAITGLEKTLRCKQMISSIFLCMISAHGVTQTWWKQHLVITALKHFTQEIQTAKWMDNNAQCILCTIHKKGILFCRADPFSIRRKLDCACCGNWFKKQ